MKTERISIEIAFALPRCQEIEALEVPVGATIEDALRLSRARQRFTELDADDLQVGVWGRVAARDHVLRQGDRIELYRPLQREPREARRELARHQRLGSSS